MRRSRYREEQIIGILTEHEAGAKCADLCRKHGMSAGTFYAWKAKYGGMTVSDAKRLKALEDENAKLKKLLAEQMLDAVAIKELLSKKVWSAVKRSAVAHLRAKLGLSERRACRIVGADRRMIRDTSRRPAETELRTRLRELANERRRFGYLPVFNEGALFSAGDGHGRQGDGEVCIAAVETGLGGRFRLTVRKDMKIDTPFAETPKMLISMGFDEDLDEAMRKAVRDMIGLVTERTGLTRNHAYMLLSLAGDLKVTQVVDGEKGVHMVMCKDWL